MIEQEAHNATTSSTSVSSSSKRASKIALVGNPNSGKTTLFNLLTGLNQRTGNFPGVTVDKKTGSAQIKGDGGINTTITFIDLPGTYSLYPKSIDERVAFEVLCDPTNPDYPDMALLVIDASNIRRSFFLASQAMDLQLPVVIALNREDIMQEKGIRVDVRKMAEKLGVPVVSINAKKAKGISDLQQQLIQPMRKSSIRFMDVQAAVPELIKDIKDIVTVSSDYAALQVAINYTGISYFNAKTEKKEKIRLLVEKHKLNRQELQTQETLERYKRINKTLEDCYQQDPVPISQSTTQRLDRILTHKVGGYLIFLLVLGIIFQAVFYLASFPMEYIESFFSWLGAYANTHLPSGALNDLLVNGVLAGLSGVLIFIPQIALLFGFLTILEDSGYMARVSFIMDKPMRRFGLNGRSVIPLISGAACAVPAIMSTRTISNWKERMITIMVTPLMSCSARLPVYTLLISLVIPEDKQWGIFNLQGLTLMGFYLIGTVAALFIAWLMHLFIKAKERSYFIMELPIYQWPRWSSVGITVWEKIKVFVIDAGKIIIAISIVLWVLSTNGPGDRMQQIEQKYAAQVSQEGKAMEQLEASYAGILGKAMEPIIQPLGFDWKIGISLVTSFAAREVFVGTMATIYSVGDQENTQSIRERMSSETHPVTGKKVYSLAVGLSLMVFYAFAMQCMSTIAVVYRETKHWKWPLIQFVYMGILAYAASFITYHLFS
jgi:ferrous iron transport protein B